jgi:tetratricopeptide (TPR) repeat protein
MRPILTFAVVCLLSTSAFAQSKKPDVKKLNEEGIAAFEAGRFEEAAQKFQDAWKLDPDPTLRKNEAIAWYKANRCNEASAAGTSYLDSSAVDKETRIEIHAVLANCRVSYAREAMGAKDFVLAEKFIDEAEVLALSDPPKETIRVAREDLAKAREAEAQALAEAQQKAALEAAAKTPPPEVESSSPVLPWAITGAGAAILASAAVYHVIAATSMASEYEDVAAAGEDRARYDELASSLDTARWLVPTLYAIGAATTGVGVYFLMEQDSSQPTAAPTPAGGVTFSGRF